jgi:hypothetical protein
MGFKITGIDTPFGGFSWELGQTKKEKAIALLDFLTGQRILFNSCDVPCDNCQEYSNRSVIKIKDFVNNQISDIGNENDYKNCLRQIRDICNNYLNEPICQKLLIYIPNSNMKVLCPVAKYRKDIAYHMRIVTSMFRIKINNDLHRVFCINGLLA